MPPPDPVEPGTVEVVLSVPLGYDVGDRSVHCPMVDALVGGVATKLIVDTGATDQVFTLDLVDRVGLPYTAGEPGTDVTGAPIASHDVGRVEMSLGGVSMPLEDVITIEGPPPFAGWGVGGFLSPQRLLPHATVVLDLIDDRLLVIDGSAEAVRSYLDADFDRHTRLAGARHAAGTLGVRARVEPHEEVVALFDSGAASTDASAAAVGGQAPLAEMAGFGVGGGGVEAGRMPDRTLAVATARFHVPVLGVRSAIPAPDGAPADEAPQVMIGMDVMRGSALAIPPRASGLLWWYVSAAR